MDIYIDNNNNLDNITISKMTFIFNAINDGWIVEKQLNNNNNEEKYIFRKNHENKKEIFSNNYLEKFISKNFQN
tara:strand:+ start:6636 stop:6857 length:222 start_codon:yes stop_codon:yes gene_type:complete